jgi:DNA (cytosine-5)-methyltransferase 1
MILDLFAGPGGLDHGSHLAGHDTIGIEKDVNAVATRQAAGLATVHGDVRNYGPADFPTAYALAGGPPCQTFTVAGAGAGRDSMAAVLDAVKLMGAREPVDAALLGDERTGLVLEPLRWILEAADSGHPYRAVVLEQVQQVQQVWNAYAEVLRAEGYSVGTGVVKAEEYGVPQTRRRAVLVARRDGLTGVPRTTHRPWRRRLSEVESYLSPTVTMGDVLPGRGPFTVISNYGTGGDPKNRGRRTSGEPAFTVTGKISRFRIVDADGREQDRFSHSEAGRLQGFPTDWPWSGNDIGQQIGNAVPPPLAAALVLAAAGRGTV